MASLQNADNKTTMRLMIIIIRAAMVQIFFGSVLIFYVGFQLFWFGSSDCVYTVCISHSKHVPIM